MKTKLIIGLLFAGFTALDIYANIAYIQIDLQAGKTYVMNIPIEILLPLALAMVSFLLIKSGFSDYRHKQKSNT